MNRTDFGPWGLELNDDDFARALAALLVLGLHAYEDDLPAVLKQTLADEEPVELRPLRITLPVPKEMSAAALRDAWVSVQNAGQRPRLELSGADPLPETFWISAKLIDIQCLHLVVSCRSV